MSVDVGGEGIGSRVEGWHKFVKGIFPSVPDQHPPEQKDKGNETL